MNAEYSPEDQKTIDRVHKLELALNDAMRADILLNGDPGGPALIAAVVCYLQATTILSAYIVGAIHDKSGLLRQSLQEIENMVAKLEDARAKSETEVSPRPLPLRPPTIKPTDWN